MINYDKADTMANMTDEQRASGRTAALLGDTTEKQKPQGNLVEKEMKRMEAEDEYESVFDEASRAVEAARQACQDGQEGVQSEKELDAIADKCLGDLLAVIGKIRDNRSDIMSAIADKENADAPDPLQS